jgi:DNA-binding transcriptional ArsR family regulator
LEAAGCLSGKTAQSSGITTQSSTLAELLSSRVKAEVFRLLFGLNGQPLHLRELERQSGLAISTVRQELDRLTRLGLVEPRVDGNRRYYAACEDHPLYPEIRGLVLKTSGLADLLHEALRKEKSIRVAFVFGSIARGDEHTHSDIDLLVIGKIGMRQLTKRLSGIASRVGREINPKILSPEEFQKRRRDGDHFLKSVLSQPRIFIVGDEHELGTMG